MKNYRFPIRFDGWYALLSTMLFLPPRSAYVDVSEAEVRVCMGWAFSAQFSKSAVKIAELLTITTLSRGVHGWAGRWLVNGSGRGIVTITLEPAPRGYVLGCPIRLRELMVSVLEPEALLAALRTKNLDS